MNKNKMIFGITTIFSITCIIIAFDIYNFNHEAKLLNDSLKQEIINNQKEKINIPQDENIDNKTDIEQKNYVNHKLELFIAFPGYWESELLPLRLKP